MNSLELQTSKIEVQKRSNRTLKRKKKSKLQIDSSAPSENCSPVITILKPKIQNNDDNKIKL